MNPEILIYAIILYGLGYEILESQMLFFQLPALLLWVMLGHLLYWNGVGDDDGGGGGVGAGEDADHDVSCV